MEAITPEALKIAEFIESLVPDGATLQTGIGTIPSAVLAALRINAISASTPK
ncbi:MAG: hypothetical protein WDM76_14480 [Limisphaerales bacterium]